MFIVFFYFLLKKPVSGWVCRNFLSWVVGLSQIGACKVLHQYSSLAHRACVTTPPLSSHSHSTTIQGLRDSKQRGGGDLRWGEERKYITFSSDPLCRTRRIEVQHQRLGAVQWLLLVCVAQSEPIRTVYLCDKLEKQPVLAAGSAFRATANKLTGWAGREKNNTAPDSWIISSKVWSRFWILTGFDRPEQFVPNRWRPAKDGVETRATWQANVHHVLHKESYNCLFFFFVTVWLAGVRVRLPKTPFFFSPDLDPD